MPPLSEWQSKSLLGPIPRPKEALTHTREKAIRFARSLACPVVAKASGLDHKSDRRAVRMDAQVAAVWDELAAIGDGTVLVAEQVNGELELIAGGLRDSQFGPIVSVGLGGVAAEVFRDIAFLLYPYDRPELDRAISRLRCAALFDGYRGRPPVDRDALAGIMDAIGDLLERDPEVVEVDVNPILVRDGAPLVVDALVVTR